MIHNETDTLETQIYAIARDLTHHKVATIEGALRQWPQPILVVVKSNSGRTQSHFNQDYFAHSAYQFIRPGTADAFYEEQGWRLLRITEPHNRSRTSFATVADPTGATKELYNEQLASGQWPTFFQLEGICNTLRLLRVLSTYQSWEHFEQVKGDVFLALQQVELTTPYYNPSLLRARRRVYLWKLSGFLTANHSQMSPAEVYQHLVRNHLTDDQALALTEETTLVLLQDTQQWLAEEVGEPAEAQKLTRAFGM